MDRGAWWSTVHGVARVRQDLATKPPHIIVETETMNTFSRPNFSLNFSPNCILLLELIIKSQFSYLVFQIIGGIRAQTLTIINFAEFPLLYTSGIIFQNSKQFLVTFQINCTLALIYTTITYLEKFVNLNSIPKIFFYM